jgi:hypothetical protein
VIDLRVTWADITERPEFIVPAIRKVAAYVPL